MEVGPAPRLRGLSQLPLPPPSRRCALSPSRCSAGCHRRAKPRRRAVLGLGVCCPTDPGPPPLRGRPFSTADSGQPALSERSQAEKTCEPCSASRSVSLSEAGALHAASSFLQPPSHPPKEAASVPQGYAPREQGAARGHLPVPGGPDTAPSRGAGSALSSRPAGKTKTSSPWRDTGALQLNLLKYASMARNRTQH